jgi:hypothetical protein
VNLHAIEEALDDDQRLVCRFLDGAVNVEQFL